jgi:hypothetical protein
MTDIETVRENMSVLQDDILYLEQQLDRLDPESPAAESKERILNVKWRLFEEQRDILDRLESNIAREAAEERWKYHEENDTLDLY